jgi:acyl carrier protein
MISGRTRWGNLTTALSESAAQKWVPGGMSFQAEVPPKIIGRGAVGFRRVDYDRAMSRDGELKMQDLAASVQDRVLSVVRSVLEQSAITADLHAEARLVDIGLGSVDMVALMLKVEAEFDLTLPEPEITPENFESVKTLELMILNQLRPRAGFGEGAGADGPQPAPTQNNQNGQNGRCLIFGNLAKPHPQ